MHAAKLKSFQASSKTLLSLWLSNTTGGIRVFLRIFTYSSRQDRLLLSISCLASVCAGATLPLMNLLFAQLVRSFNGISADQPQEISGNMGRIVNQYVLYIVYLFIGRLFLSYAALTGFRIASLRVSANIRLEYLQALLRQPISALDVIPPGQTTAIITLTANILQLGISERLSSLIQATSVISVALVIGCIFSWQLTLVTATGLVAIVVWYQIITPRIVRRYAKVQKLETEAAGIVAEALSRIRMVAACGAEKKILDGYAKVLRQMDEESRKLSPLLALQHSPVFFATYTTFALCFWFTVRLYIKAEFVDVKILVVVLMSVLTMLAHISAVSVPLTAASNSVNAARVFFTIIDAPVKHTSGCKEENVIMDADVLLENVNFTYPLRHDVQVLQNLNLKIPVGKTTAIVGPSGSGKSTVVALIQRWYELGECDPVTCFFRNGSIKIGPRNLNEIDLHWWRSCIGLVQQEPFLFNDTILANVEYGLVGTQWENALAKVKEELVYQSCKEAFADDFISRLPHGYHTLVGEKRLHLSGGQRQRIAIARAIVRKPQILIFDEATSALDVTSERIVQAALNNVAKTRTTIIIAHRLSTVKNADQIVVLAKGHVLQQGTHSELIQIEGGAYWKLVSVQSLNAAKHPESVESYTQGPMETNRVSLREESVKMSKPPEDCEKPISTSHDSISSSNVLKTCSSLLGEQSSNFSSYFILIAAAVGAAVCTPLQAYLFGRLISSFSKPLDELKETINFLCLMLLVVAVGIGLSYFIIGWVSNTVAMRVVAFYRKDYLRSMIFKPISFFDNCNNSVGLLSTRLATDPAQLQQLLGTNMAMALIAVLGLIGCVAIAILFNWQFALIVMAPSLPIILAGGWYRVRFEIQFESRNSKVFGESARFATEAIGAMRTVASLNLEQTVCRKYNGLLRDHIRTSWKDARLSGLVFAASDSMVLLCMAFALWYGGRLLARFQISTFDFLVVYLAIIQGTLAAGQWLSFGPNLAQVSTAAERIHSIRPSKTSSSGDHPRRGRRWNIPGSLLWKGATIDFRDVWFAYPERDVAVVRGLSMTIRQGQFAGIVGSSGSGKTTVISLLERFYKPQQGSIYYNGDSLDDIPLDELRKRLSLVAQEASLFRGTIRDNIMFGIEGGLIDEERFHKACLESGLDAFVSSLPDGYDTDIGTAGILLSGGQKQRISIARALIRDPAVLLLDEATSSLDSESERQVQAIFETSRKGRTRIVVAHRLSTIQRADVIFVMDQGRLVEQGNHQSLLQQQGYYWMMCQNQALGI